MTDTPAELTPEQKAAADRIALGILRLVVEEHDNLPAGLALQAVILGAAGAIESLRSPGQSERARIGLAIKIGSMLTDQIIELGAATDVESDNGDVGIH
jgi:hypothetical protein